MFIMFYVFLLMSAVEGRASHMSVRFKAHSSGTRVKSKSIQQYKNIESALECGRRCAETSGCKSISYETAANQSCLLHRVGLNEMKIMLEPRWMVFVVTSRGNHSRLTFFIQRIWKRLSK